MKRARERMRVFVAQSLIAQFDQIKHRNVMVMDDSRIYIALLCCCGSDDGVGLALIRYSGGDRAQVLTASGYQP